MRARGHAPPAGWFDGQQLTCSGVSIRDQARNLPVRPQAANTIALEAMTARIVKVERDKSAAHLTLRWKGGALTEINLGLPRRRDTRIHCSA